MGGRYGVGDILRYAPLYYPNYKVEINNGAQFIFSITYMEMSQENVRMSPKTDRNVPGNQEMSQETRRGDGQMSQEISVELDDEDLKISLGDIPVNKKAALKKRKRQQGIIGLIRQDPNITMEEMAEKLDVHERTIKRDIEELKNVIEHVGSTKGGHWVILI